MKKEFILRLEDLNTRSYELLTILKHYKVWLLQGEMGSGKTTLVRALAHALGNEEEASSPTYTLINEYIFGQNEFNIEKINHLDLYRIKDLEEAMSIGLEEVLSSTAISIIEWPEIILPLLQHESIIHIKIQTLGEGKRKYTITTD